MTFLRKLINLSGCAKLKKKNDNEIIENNDDLSMSDPVDNDSLIHPASLSVSSHSYVPWQSPRLTSRRLLDRVKQSPRVARRMLSTMTSPRPGKRSRGHEDAEEIFVVSMRLMGQESGVSVAVSRNNKVDSWWAKEKLTLISFISCKSRVGRQQANCLNKRDYIVVWSLESFLINLDISRTSMGEDVTRWIFEYLTDDEVEESDNEEDSSDDSANDWHILREVAESERF